MLSKIIAAIGNTYQYLLLFVAGGLFLVMLNQAYAVQNQAQFLATAQGKYGGYTVEADNTLKDFVNEFNIKPGDIDVTVSAPNNPVPWGTPVGAEITTYFHFKVGEVIDLKTPIAITGRGRSVSSYEPGNYSVTYMSPSY